MVCQLRVYAVADIHGKKEFLKLIKEQVKKHRPDILVLPGDISGFFRPDEVYSFLEGLGPRVLAVRGNSDPLAFDKLARKYPGITPLHLRKTVINKIPFAGLGGTIPVPFHSRICLNERALLQKAAPMVDGDTVLVAHTPPRGAQDLVMGKYHAGSCGLATFVLERKPKLVICGHIHENPGVTKLGESLVANCAMGKTGAGAIIDFYEGDNPSIVFI